MKSDNVHVFTASTPLNALFCASKAKDVDGEKHLYLIDLEHHFAESLASSFSLLERRVFSSVSLLGLRNKGVFKLAKRKKIIKKIGNRPEFNCFNYLWVCNDRRIENQYLISQAKKNQAEVCYIDDGLYSYEKKQWSDNGVISPFNTFVRRIIYGRWVYQVDVIAASYKINAAALMLQDYAISELKNKKMIGISPQYFREIISDIYPLKKEYKGILVILPHSSQMSEDFIKKIVLFVNQKKEHCVVKRHPRDSSLPKELSGFSEVDGNLPAEVFISNSKFSSVICGKSTVLITAKWLGVDNVISFFEEPSLKKLKLKSLI